MTDETKKRPGCLKKVAIMAIAFLIAGLLAEGLVLLVKGEQVKFPRRVISAPWGLRYNQPNARYRHKSKDVEVWFRINGQGMRADRDFAYEKPAGTLRIASLGDSFTVGYEVDVEECFSSVVERELRARGYEVEVLNFGVSGFSTAEECLYLEREVLKYDPDLVLVSFYTNDPKDNLRTGLFRFDRLEDDLVPAAESYDPGGWKADLLNTNPVLAWLSQYSNAFALLKEQTTLRWKRQMIEDNLEKFAEENQVEIDPESLQQPSEGDLVPPQERFGCAIFERVYVRLQEQGIPLVVHSIPHVDRKLRDLVDLFPARCFDTTREGVAYVSAREELQPHFDRTLETGLEGELLYWQNSHKHWTPFSHDVAGKAIAETIDAQGLLPKE